MRGRTLPSWLSRAALLLAVLGLHFFLAPATVRLTNRTSAVILQEWHSYRTQKYLGHLSRQEGTCREDFIPCVMAFRNLLAAQNIKLRILLRPSNLDLCSSTGDFRWEPTEGALSLVAAERALKKAGIRSVNLLPDMYTEMLRHPDRPISKPDGHYTDELTATMAKTLYNSFDDQQKQRSGRTLLLIGDCYAVLTAMELKKEALLPNVRSQWKNASDSQMAYEISRISPEQFTGVREIYWFVSAPSLSSTRSPMPFPSPPDPNAPVSEKLRTVRGRITRLSQVPLNLDSNSPYPNAHALHEFTTDSGEKLLALVPVMRDHQKLVSRHWVLTQQLLLTIQPWDAATRAAPALGREQVFDDIQDFSTERYFVTSWVHAP